VKLVSTRERTVEANGGRDVKIEHDGDDKKGLTLTFWVTPAGRRV
jgi:hypothetical protein